MESRFGKIRSVRFGAGGYDDAMFGFSFDLGGDGWGVGDFWGTWSTRSTGAKWTIEDQNKTFLESLLKVKALLKDAKKNEFSQLVGVPIEVTFNANTLSTWRILTEVI